MNSTTASVQSDEEPEHDLADRVAQLERDMSEKVTRTSLNVLLSSFGDVSDFTADPAQQKSVLEGFVETVTELEQRVAELEAENERLHERLGDDDRQDRIADLVEFATNKRQGQDVVAVSREELKGVFGCSRRWSYTLVDAEEGLPQKHPWILSDQEMRENQYGSVERSDTDQKRIGIDFTGRVSDGCPVNRFITQQGKEGVEE